MQCFCVTCSTVVVVAEYFLEDAIEMVRFMPPVPDKKRKKTSLEDFEEDEVKRLTLILVKTPYYI